MDGLSEVGREIVSSNYAPLNAAIARYVEKLEQPDPRIASQAFREKARGFGHVLQALGVAALLTLTGVSLTVLCLPRGVDATAMTHASEAPLVPPVAGRPPVNDDPDGPVVVNYTLFTTVPAAEGMEIVTGWNFASSTDRKPVLQYCYLMKPQQFGSHQVAIARVGEAGSMIERSSLTDFTSVIREIEYEAALSKCRWFR